MSSSPWAVLKLTGFTDRSGSPAVLRARLGAKVLYNFTASSSSFRGDAAELVLSELSPKSSLRPAAVQGPLDRRTCVACPFDFATHQTQQESVFPGDLVVRSSASRSISRELVLADLFDRFPAAVRELRIRVFDRCARGSGATIDLPWFGTRCALYLFLITLFFVPVFA